MTFTEFAEKFGGGSQVPSADLYNYLIEHKRDLVNEAALGVDRVPSSPLGKEVRRRSCTDLRWLAQYFLWDAMDASNAGEKPVTDNMFLDPQYDIFAELFVKKNPEVAPEDLTDIKTMLLLWPRGGMKSSYDHIDTVQWVLAYPDIEVLYVTAELGLSTGFIGEIKGYFTLKDDPTFINLFFPEYCLPTSAMRKGNRFDCPIYKAKKTGRKEPTVWASSVGKTKAGWHPRVLKFDDAVSDINSETEEQQTKTSKKLFLAERLLKLGGFYKHYIGTRYGEAEHYGVLLDKYQENGDIDTTEGRGWKFYHNKTHAINILIGRGVQIKPEVIARLEQQGRPTTYQEAGEEGCILLLPAPKLMPWKWLMTELSKDEKIFEGQINQNPRPVSNIEFSRSMMRKAVVDFTKLPRQGPVSIVWDFAFSAKKKRDYSTGCSILWSEEDEYAPVVGPNGETLRYEKTGRRKTVGYVRKIIRERFNTLSLAKAVVNFAREEQAFVVGVENASGSQLLEETIIAEAIRTKDPRTIAVCSHIDWFKVDNQDDAKRIRMRAMYPWLVEERLFFLNSCMYPQDKYPNLEVLFNEYEKCLDKNFTGHNDIPDVVSQQPRYAPRATQALVENNMQMFWQVDRLGWEEVFIEGFDGSQGKSGMVIQVDEQGNPIYWSPDMLQQLSGPSDPMFNPPDDIKPDNPYGMPNMLGAGIYG
jgi:hypothetical protein